MKEFRFWNRLSKQPLVLKLEDYSPVSFIVSAPLCGNYEIIFPKKRTKGYGMTPMTSKPVEFLKKWEPDENDLELLTEMIKDEVARRKREAMYDRYRRA